MSRRSKSFAERLPAWMGSIRVRLTVLYSVVLFGLASLVVLGIYAGVSRTLADEPIGNSASFDAVIVLSDGQVIGRNDREAQAFISQLEESIKRRALNKLRPYSFTALGLLFVGSLGVGYFVAGRVLRPIGRITAVARDIQATDLSRRIDMRSAVRRTTTPASRRSSTVASGSDNATSRLVRMTASGLRSSCDASWMKRR